MQVVTRKAVKRVGVLMLVLGAVCAWCGCTMIWMPGKSFCGPLPPLTADQTTLRDELRGHVEKLAGEIGERNIYQPRKLNAAAEHIEAVLAESGHRVSKQTFQSFGETCHNLDLEIPGTTLRDEIIVIGAHYDTAPGTAGAGDNASGTAALLALAKLPALQNPARTLRLVAFVNEEPPHFQTDAMGSLVYARRCRDRSEKIIVMLSLESLGYYSTAKGSQKYPFPIGLAYPSQGDFVAFVSRSKDAKWVRECITTFRKEAQFPSEGAALPARLPGVDWSDHWAFWQAGYPAVMVTDTAIFRSPNYHQETDTPETLDYERFARVTAGAGKVIAALANP